ncbi:snf2 family helicase atpase [Trichoderma cornu-damae]|uniref:Snf2 family helicase atpase n=1 Tax=Trichoderma cornu-damae TaxID=654480 RepID=A0A9P8QHF3_9HYPO|nr:snf2 family helicase atpase [Trichoderma cornu-damae]
MARKRLPRKPLVRLTFDIGHDDVLPAAFLDFFDSLSTPSPSELTIESPRDIEPQPPSKRRKIDREPDAGICIARAEISFSRRCEKIASPDYRSVHRGVESLLKFGLINGHLSISTRPSSRLGHFSAHILLRPQDADQNAAKIFDIERLNSKRAAGGAIRTAADVAIEQRQGDASVTICFQLFWNDTPSPYALLRRSDERRCSEKLIHAFFAPEERALNSASWSPMDFYNAAHVPPKDDTTSLSIDVPGLHAALFPYQKRTLQWLLRREGVKWSAQGAAIHPLSEEEQKLDLDLFRCVNDANNHKMYLSDVFQAITRDPIPYYQASRLVKGGILAEEMGLGKTLEMIGLILLHRRQAGFPPEPPLGQEHLVPSGATFIVTPRSLQPQWMSELSRHAPGLRVKHYTGCRGVDKEDEARLVAELAGYDVVVTTYNVLSAELHFAVNPPERSRRFERAYRRVLSPLVQISWWRVCLDEAQMIESGVSQAAALARAIPRANAWAITGTPVKDDVKDLLGLLSFLGYEPYCSAPQVWQALTTHHKPLFQQLFKSISIRHTKALVRDEIALPPQRRYVITMPFTAVEEQHYQSLYKEMAEACKLNAEGRPLAEDWDPEAYEEVMRLWLNRLRQTALHPEVGVYGRRVLGSKERPMRTVEEVLNAMLEQGEAAIRIDERAYLSSRLFLGQLFENSPRVKEALAIWEEVRVESAKLVNDSQVALRDALREKRGAKDAGETPERVHDLSDSDSDMESEGEAEGEVGNRGKFGELQNRLRNSLELHHKAVFFCANAHFQIRDNPEMTAPDSEEFQRLKKLEDDGYESAKLIRRKILGQGHRKAMRLMNKVALKAKEQSFVEIPELVMKGERGIESGSTVDSLRILCDELNGQANLIDEWREQVVQLLLRPLVDEEGENAETTGEELADSTKVQDELVVYVQVLRAIIADRQFAISGQTNGLARHEIETSIRLARDGVGPAPEKLLELVRRKAEVKPKTAVMSMRGAISELRSLVSRLTRDSGQSQREVLESTIASSLMKSTQTLLGEQNKAAVALEAEIESFKRAMNARLDYYRQLQAVSDDVLPLEAPKTEEAIEKAKKNMGDLHRKLLSGEAKHRYLLSLKETGSRSNEARMCVICQMPFMTGVLTVCGHQFCKECIMIWFKAHRNCPVCKRVLKADNLHDIIIKPRQLRVHGEEPSLRKTGSVEDSPRTRRDSSKQTVLYSEFDAEELEQMKNIELDGPSFTTKVDTLVRHLMWLRESDPGAKSIVFSQYRDFLKILRNAFARFRIGYASIDDADGITRFKEDPAVECFLLHARAHSSGLNLVNASHVFLCEPLLNTALELQAIARVDRIGQRHETTVWLYIVSGTVEESIYNLSVRRRMEHMGRNLKGKSKESTPELLDANIEEANTLELEQAALSRLMSKDRSAGEMVDQSDLWECLFGHVNGKDSQRN